LENALAPPPQNSLLQRIKSAAKPDLTPENIKLAASFLPVVGDAISGYDAVQAAREGNYSDALLFGLGILPFVPSMAAGPKVTKSLDLFSPEAVNEAVRNAQNVKAKETLAFIKPADFLSLARKLDRPDADKLNSIRKAISENKPLDDVPFLILDVSKDRSRARVSGHEGRHRAMVLAEQGVEYMPVRVMPQEYIGSDKQWGPAYSKVRNEDLLRLPSKVRQEQAPQNFLLDPFRTQGFSK
jgi:hypothetical protein